MKLSKLFFLPIMISLLFPLQAQSPASGRAPEKTKKHPSTFTISKADIDKLFSFKAGEMLVSKKNKYLNRSVVVTNIQNGDTKFLRVQLSYFSSAFLSVQVNGSVSTQVFILSEDKSVSYKGKADGKNYLMSKCDQDEIISE